MWWKFYHGFYHVPMCGVTQTREVVEPARIRVWVIARGLWSKHAFIIMNTNGESGHKHEVTVTTLDCRGPAVF